MAKGKLYSLSSDTYAVLSSGKGYLEVILTDKTFYTYTYGGQERMVRNLRKLADAVSRVKFDKPKVIKTVKTKGKK